MWEIICLVVGFACGAVFGAWNKRKVQDTLNKLQDEYNKIRK